MARVHEVHFICICSVDTPTERRVKRWSFELMELFSDPRGLHEFKGFLEKEYSSENINFWLAVEQLKHGPQSEVKERAEGIFRSVLFCCFVVYYVHADFRGTCKV
jgi:hypothetical protein